MAKAAKRKILSDEEMNALESNSPKRRELSDEEMAALEGNPSDQRANGRPLDLLKEFKEAGYKTAAPEFLNDALNFGAGLGDRITSGNTRYYPPAKRLMEGAQAESPNAFLLGGGAGELAKGVGTAMLPGGLPAQIAAGAALGAAENPNKIGASGDIDERIKNAELGAAIPLGLGVLGKGAGKVGDYAMQKAVGAREYLSGLGTRIADENLIGTRGMMRRQIERPEGADAGWLGKLTDFMGKYNLPLGTGKLASREAALQTQIPKIKGMISSTPSVNAISSEGAKLVPVNPNISISSGNTAAVKAAEERALEAASRGNLSPGDALDVARKIDRAAYDNAIPAGRFAKKLDRADSGAIRGELKNQADRQGLPKVRRLLEREQALIQARQAMDSPEPVMNQLLRAGLGATLGGGATYYATRDPWSAVLGAAATTPAGMSTIGQVGTKAPQSVPYLTPAAISVLVKKSQEEP